MKTILALLLAIASLASAKQASVTLTWDPPPETGIAGYRLYSGLASGQYTNTVNVAATRHTVTNLVFGAKYFFAVTAVSTHGLESPYSNELPFAVPAKPTAPVITGTMEITGKITIEFK